MSGEPSSNRQPKRINTGLSEVSAYQPKSSGSGSGGRLSLHIPNSYPRALSPRTPTSRNGTPESSRPASPSVQYGPSRESVYSALKGAQETPRAGGRTAQTRVFRRDSSLITIHHNDGAGASAEVHLSSTTPGRLLSPFKKLVDFFSVNETSSSSARDFLARERNFFSWLRLSCLLAILSASLILQLQLPDTARASSTPKTPKAPVSWDNLPLTSKAFAGVFFVLSLLSLGTGLADYLSAERQLEKEQVDFDETEGVFLNDAHTSAFVHTVMLVVGAGITASAVWLLAY